MFFVSDGTHASITHTQPHKGVCVGCVRLRVGTLLHLWFRTEIAFVPVPEKHEGLYGALLKSQVQKCVRRGKGAVAVATARAMLGTARGVTELLRRLPVIAVEDVGPVEWLPQLVWFMSAGLKDKRLLRWPVLLDWLLGAVLNLAECRSEDAVENAAVAQALRIRASYGGMPGDLELLRQRAVGGLALAGDPVTPLPFRDVAPLKHDEVLSAAADFHCLPTLPDEVAARLDGQVTAAQVRAAIWHCSSARNVRRAKTPEYRALKPLWTTIKRVVKEVALEGLQRR